MKKLIEGLGKFQSNYFNTHRELLEELSLCKFNRRIRAITNIISNPIFYFKLSFCFVLLRLNNRNIPVHISTFSKASKNRSTEIFEKILNKGLKKLKKKKGKSKDKIF